MGSKSILYMWTLPYGVGRNLRVNVQFISPENRSTKWLRAGPDWPKTNGRERKKKIEIGGLWTRRGRKRIWLATRSRRNTRNFDLAIRAIRKDVRRRSPPSMK